MVKEKKPAEDREAIFHAICEDIAGGESMAQACKPHGWFKMTFFRYKLGDAEREELYQQARQANADVQASRIIDESIKLLDDPDITPGQVQAIRVATDNLKWIASRQHGRDWGDNKTTTHEIGSNFVNALERIEDSKVIQGKVNKDSVVDLVGVEEVRAQTH